MVKVTKTIASLSSSAFFHQDGDSCSPDIDQTLEIESQDAGGGTYYVIKTDRWAFDSLKELTDMLQRFIDAHSAGEKTIQNEETKRH